MGWEWHNRGRDWRGRWERQNKTERMYIRCTPMQLDQIRGRAYARQMDISEYILDLVQRDLLRKAYDIDLPANG